MKSQDDTSILSRSDIQRSLSATRIHNAVLSSGKHRQKHPEELKIVSDSGKDVY